MTDLEQVLEMVNTGRQALGAGPLEELPRGKRRSQSQCVLARALGLRFSETSAWLGEGPASRRRTVAATLVEGWGTRPRVVDRRAVRLPDPLRRFVKEFDLGCFPELVDEPARVGIPEASVETETETERPLVSV